MWVATRRVCGLFALWGLLLRLGEPWFLVYTNFLLPQTHASSGVGVTLRASGEIGRHAGFRFLCLMAWGFKSPLAHTHIYIGPAVTVFVAAGFLVCALPGWVCLARLGVEPLS